MTLDDYRAKLRDGHDHATIDEAGQCQPCRERNIAAVRDLYGDPETSDVFHHYVLRFTDPDPDGETIGRCEDHHEPIRAGRHLGTAIVPAPDFSAAVDNAWACGCNPGGQVAGQEIPHELVYRAGPAVRTCELLTGEDYDAAMEALRVATYHLGN